ncbi:MAG: ATP-binding cassette domain-containing protein, partial [Gammaproteobacteria bacterium]|nr:ATP-binding cassette domain-containing protein [Gammaproteobacteria bacterium]
MSDSSSTVDAASSPVVAVRDVQFSLAGRPVFQGLDLQARRGAITAIMGPSGTGKTTLLRLITGQIEPAAGSVTVFGESLATQDRDARYAMRRRMGMLFQNGALLTEGSTTWMLAMTFANLPGGRPILPGKRAGSVAVLVTEDNGRSWRTLLNLSERLQEPINES